MTIVQTTGVSVNSLGSSKTLSQRIQSAVEAAIREQQAAGVTDPELIKAAMLAARAKAKKDWTDAVNLASAAASQPKGDAT